MGCAKLYINGIHRPMQKFGNNFFLRVEFTWRVAVLMIVLHTMEALTWKSVELWWVLWAVFQQLWGRCLCNIEVCSEYMYLSIGCSIQPLIQCHFLFLTLLWRINTILQCLTFYCCNVLATFCYWIPIPIAKVNYSTSPHTSTNPLLYMQKHREWGQPTNWDAYYHFKCYELCE